MSMESKSPGSEEFGRRKIAEEAEALRERSNMAFEQPIKEYALRENTRYMESFERNKELFAQIVLKYAANWASLMEKKMKAGEKLEEIAASSSAEAFDDVIKGTLYCHAVSILADSWEHGEELKDDVGSNK